MTMKKKKKYKQLEFDFKDQITINLDDMKPGYNGLTKRDYLWTILDDKKGNACYEIQLTKLEFPSSIKAVRQGRYGKAIQLD